MSRSGSPKIDYSPYEAMWVNELTARLLHDFQDAILSEVNEDDLEMFQRRRCTANSLMLNARCFFTRTHMEYYRQPGSGLRVPDPDKWDFLKVKPLDVRKLRYRLPPYPVIKAILEGHPKLKGTDLNAWRAAWLILHTGLQQQGGNSDANTTNRHYADSQMPDSLKTFWEEGVI